MELVARTEVIEYCLLPIAALLPTLDCQTALHDLFRTLLGLSTPQPETNQRVVPDDVIAERLQLSVALVGQIADIIGSFLPFPITFDMPDGRKAVSVHALTLFLLAQLYGRQAQKHDQVQQGDLWPSAATKAADSAEMPAEPQSPASPGRRGRSGEGTHGRHTSKAQRGLLEKASRSQSVLADNFQDFVRRNVRKILLLVRDDVPPPSASGGALDRITLSAAEFDRFALMIAPYAGPRSPAGKDGENAAPTGEPTPPSMTPAEQRDALSCLSKHVPLFEEHNGQVPLPLLAQYLQGKFRSDAARANPHTEIRGVTKSSVLRGTKKLAPSDSMRIRGCHDCIIYLLAPVHNCLISACTDCTIVVGAVGGFIRIEHCDSVALVATCRRILISTCHDCVLHLGTNHEPLVLGDNRFVQVAPYNTRYQGLAKHMEAAGVAPGVNLWDKPIELSSEDWQVRRDKYAPDSGAPGAAKEPAQPVTLLPPDKLLPFLIPFTGGDGPLVGSVAPSAAWSKEARGGSGRSGSASSSTGKEPDAFPLPPAYETSVAAKVRSVSELRASVKSADLEDGKKRELQAVIQAHFKEWLVTSGNMRQVYDLARIERDVNH